MKKVIRTKYLPATTNLAPRIVAWAEDNAKLYAPWDDDISNEANHSKAAREFMFKMNWHGELAMGFMGRGKGVVHVFLPDEIQRELDIRRAV